MGGLTPPRQREPQVGGWLGLADWRLHLCPDRPQGLAWMRCAETVCAMSSCL